MNLFMTDNSKSTNSKDITDNSKTTKDIFQCHHICQKCTWTVQFYNYKLLIIIITIAETKSDNNTK